MDYLRYKEHRIPTELAITADEQEKGLMYKQNLPEAMAFVYTEPRISKFWMKNTPQPLDIIFSLHNKIVSIAQGVPHSTELIGGHHISDLVVEMPLGTAKRLGMRIGDDIQMEYRPESLSRILLTATKV